MSTTINRLMIVTCCTCLAFIGGTLYGRAGMAEQRDLDLYKNAVTALKASVKAANDRADGERALRDAEWTALSTHLKEKEVAHQAADRLIADLRADNRRLRVPVRMPTCPAAIPSGSVEPGAGHEGHAELTADAGEFLVGLLKRGDDGIRKHGAVVDSYNRLAAECGKPLIQEPAHATP